MQSFRSQIWAVALYGFDSIVLLARRIFPAHLPNKVNGRPRIVMIRPDALGDVILWSSAFTILQELYPRSTYQWVWVGNPAWFDLVDLFGVFEEKIRVDPTRFRSLSGLLYRAATLWQIARAKADLVLHPVRSREFTVGDALARAFNSPVKVASSGDTVNSAGWRLGLADRAYSDLLSWTGPSHELEFTKRFLNHLGRNRISARKDTEFAPDLRPLLDRTHPAIDLAGRDYFVVLPGAGWTGREWGILNFLEAALQIQNSKGWLCIWAGSSVDKERHSSIVAKHGGMNNLNLMGKTSLPELLELIGGARMILTNETGSAHLGAACSIPTVAVTGGGHFGRFAPWGTIRAVHHKLPCYGCDWNCIYPPKKGQPVPCIVGVQIEQVLESVENFFSPV